MNRFICALILLLAALPLRAHLDGRIEHKGIPSLTAEIGIERQFFLYNAPVHEYISLNFGYAGTRYTLYGLTFGASFQWLDAESAAGILRIMSLFLVDRRMSSFSVGGWGEAGITAGNDTGGFSGGVSGQYFYRTDGTMYATLNLRAGAYVVPGEWGKIAILPGAGRTFITNDTFFFDIIFAIEIYLWN